MIHVALPRYAAAKKISTFGASVSVHSGLASGLELAITGPSTIERASGQTVKLECQFTLGRDDLAPLDIEWSLLASDNQKEDKVVSRVWLTLTMIKLCFLSLNVSLCRIRFQEQIEYQYFQSV